MAHLPCRSIAVHNDHTSHLAEVPRGVRKVWGFLLDNNGTDRLVFDLLEFEVGIWKKSK